MVLGPVQAFTRSDTKLRWTDRYSSDSVNRSFIGMPRGVYLGFSPIISGLTLTLAPDSALMFSALVGSFSIGTTVTGSTSGATAVIRLVRTPLPGRGVLQVTSVAGTFEEGETITAAGATAAVEQFTAESMSVAQLVTSSPLAGGRSEQAVTIVTEQSVSLDFSPGSYIDGVYHVMATAYYSAGEESFAQVITRMDPPPDGRFEVGICAVTKTGGVLLLNAITPEVRTTPYADLATRYGLTDAESLEDLSAAVQTTGEVEASRLRKDGATADEFSVSLAQTTGLPSRLNSDLSGRKMADRLGKEIVVIRGNDYSVTLPAGPTLNISGSFAALVRDHRPFRDVTNGDLPVGMDIPTVIAASGSDGMTLSVSGIQGTFTSGSKVVGGSSGATAVVRSASGSLIDINEISGSFTVNETITSSGPPVATATITGIDQREGAISAPESGLGGDPDRNIVLLLDTLSGRRPTTAVGDTIYGRLLYGPSGPAAAGGGVSGELLVASAAGEQINFTNGSTAVTGNNIDFTKYLQPGDIIEGDDGRFYEVSRDTGSVQAGSFLLSTGKPYVGPNASSGLGVGSGPRRRMRFLIKLVTKTGGVESDATIVASSIPSGASIRVFFPVWFTRWRSNASGINIALGPGNPHSLQAAGSSIPGIGYNASAGPTLQTIGALKQFQVAGAPIGPGNYHTINYQTGTLSQTAAGVIAISARGPTGPAGAPGSPSPGPVGPTGPGFDGIQAGVLKTLPITNGTGSDTFDFTPKKIRFYMITAAIRHASGGLNSGRVSDITPTPVFNTASTLTFEYKTSGGGNEIDVFCAVATN